MRKLVSSVFIKMATVKKRVSKKNKKSWRKNVDIKDVENFLEDQRLEERLGIKYAEQKNEDLFEIDVQGEKADIKAKNNETILPVRKQNVRTESRPMRLKETETPRCFQILEKRSAVPAHFVNERRLKKENSTSKVAKTVLNRKLNQKLLRERNKSEDKGKSKSDGSKKGGLGYNIWSKEKINQNLKGCSEWLSGDTVKHTLLNTKTYCKVLPKTVLTKTSLLPAIETPHPGLSYNPSIKDHSDILSKVAESEMKLIKEEKHIDRVTTQIFRKVPERNAENEWLSEMTVGLTMTKDESDEADEEEYKSINPPVKNKKKTLQKRRKLREAKLLKEKLRRQKIEKKKLSDVYKLRKFKQTIEKKEKQIAKNIEKRKQIKEMKPYTTKVLSHTKYQEPEIDFSLPEQLSGNLRGVEEEGNILFDRFKSLQKRNILEPNVKQHLKKRKVKSCKIKATNMWSLRTANGPYEG